MGGGDGHTQANPNLETLRRLDAAFGAVDLATIQRTLEDPAQATDPAARDVVKTFLEIIDPDVVIDFSQYPVGFVSGDRFEGLEGWTAFWREWLSPWSEFNYTVGEEQEVGRTLIRQVTINARGADSGAPVEWSHVQAWSFRNGRIVAVRLFETLDAARRWLEEEGAQKPAAAELVTEMAELYDGADFPRMRELLMEATSPEELNRDLGALGEFFDRVIDPEIEIDFRGFSGLAPDAAELRHGREGWMKLWQVFIEPWSDFKIADWRIIELDPENAAVSAIWRLRGVGSGIDLELEQAGLWTALEGRLVRMRAFESMDAALAGAHEEGLRVPD